MPERTSHFNNASSEVMSLYKYLQLPKNANIISRSGINWSDLYRVTPEQLREIEPLLPGRYDTRPTVGVGEMHMSILIDVYAWFNLPARVPGVAEKQRIITMLQDAMAHPDIFTGIGNEAYPKLLEKLEAIPDCPDIEGFNIHYHH